MGEHVALEAAVLNHCCWTQEVPEGVLASIPREKSFHPCHVLGHVGGIGDRKAASLVWTKVNGTAPVA